MADPSSLRDLLALVRAFVLATWPGEDAEHLTIRLRSGKELQLPVPIYPPEAPPSSPFPPAPA